MSFHELLTLLDNLQLVLVNASSENEGSEVNRKIWSQSISLMLLVNIPVVSTNLEL